MTINIIGGGIAGPVAAIALRKAGFDAVVHEAYDEGADGVGAFLTLATNGLAALRVLDLEDAVRAHGFPTPTMRLRLGSRVLAEFPMTGGRPDAPTTVTLKRADLYRVLRDEAVRRGARVEYGKRLVGAEADADGVTARFADGSSARGELLVGADGLRSTLRTVIDPHAPAPRYVPLLNTGGYARGVTVDAEPGVAEMAFGKRAFFGHLPHPDGSVWWFANLPRRTEPSAAELAAVGPEGWRRRLLDLFADDDIPAVDLIRATPEVMPGWSTYDFPSVPTWRRGRMVIIGDAAHATSPAAGQGASMAVEDAVELARCLRDLPDPDRALAAYERLRRGRVEKVVATGKRNGDSKAPGRLGRLLLPLALRLRPPGDQSWLLDHRLDWDAPVAS